MATYHSLQAYLDGIGRWMEWSDDDHVLRAWDKGNSYYVFYAELRHLLDTRRLLREATETETIGGEFEWSRALEWLDRDNRMNDSISGVE